MPVETSDDWSALPLDEPLALVRANEQLGRLLADEVVELDCSGYHDTSRSARRAILVCQLLRARYPHDEIRALALNSADLLESGHGPVLFQHDIDRLLAKYTPAAYESEPTRAVRLAAVSGRPKGGHPITLTTVALLDFYHQYTDCGVRGIVLEWIRAEVARHLGVSVDTIPRREGELIADGHIRREIYSNRQRSSVILSPLTWDVDAQRIKMPNGADSALPTSPAGVAGVGAEETHHQAAEREIGGDGATGRRGVRTVCQPVTTVSQWARTQWQPLGVCSLPNLHNGAPPTKQHTHPPRAFSISLMICVAARRHNRRGQAA